MSENTWYLMIGIVFGCAVAGSYFGVEVEKLTGSTMDNLRQQKKECESQNKECVMLYEFINLNGVENEAYNDAK